MNNFSNYGGSSFGTASQYQGNQKPYQPVGFVQSAYGQNQQQFQQQQQQQQFQQQQPQQQQQYGGNPSAQSFHTANYRGNQFGHDAANRSDSSTPAQAQQGGFQFGGNPSAQSFHTANYRGNQAGHDAANRSDSSTPAQAQQGGFQYGAGAQATYGGVSNISTQFGLNQNQFLGAQNQAFRPTASFAANQTQFGGQSNFPSAQSFHTANYRGNQSEHDAWKTSDSGTPAQQSNFGTTQFASQNQYSGNRNQGF